MSKTYRNVPEHEFLEEELKNKKVKRIDKKHDTVITVDGVYSHPINDGAKIYMGDKVVSFEGINTPLGKRITKKMTNRKHRYEKIKMEEDNDE